ncbi:TVP38/TMEM64 family protein [Chlamydiota bacterium]
MKKLMKSPWIKLGFIVIFLIVLYAIFRMLNIDFSGISKEQLRDKINAIGIWGPVLYCIFYVIRPLILFPAGVLSASAGVIWGLLKGYIILQIAANISSTIEFLMARYFARGVIEKMMKGKSVKIDKAIEKHGFLTVLLIRLIPNVAWDIQNFSLGLTKVTFRDYFFATLIGILPGSFAFVYFGSSVIAILTNPKNIWMLGIAIIIFAGVYFLQKSLRKKHGQKCETC